MALAVHTHTFGPVKVPRSVSRLTELPYEVSLRIQNLNPEVEGVYNHEVTRPSVDGYVGGVVELTVSRAPFAYDEEKFSRIEIENLYAVLPCIHHVEPVSALIHGKARGPLQGVLPDAHEELPFLVYGIDPSSLGVRHPQTSFAVADYVNRPHKSTDGFDLLLLQIEDEHRIEGGVDNVYLLPPRPDPVGFHQLYLQPGLAEEGTEDIYLFKVALTPVAGYVLNTWFFGGRGPDPDLLLLLGRASRQKRRCKQKKQIPRTAYT